MAGWKQSDDVETDTTCKQLAVWDLEMVNALRSVMNDPDVGPSERVLAVQTLHTLMSDGGMDDAAEYAASLH